MCFSQTNCHAIMITEKNALLQTSHPAGLQPNGVGLSSHWLQHQRTTVAVDPSRRSIRAQRSSEMTPCLVCLFRPSSFRSFLPAALRLKERLKQQQHVRDSGRGSQTLWPRLSKSDRSPSSLPNNNLHFVASSAFLLLFFAQRCWFSLLRKYSPLPRGAKPVQTENNRAADQLE